MKSGAQLPIPESGVSVLRSCLVPILVKDVLTLSFSIVPSMTATYHVIRLVKVLIAQMAIAVSQRTRICTEEKQLLLCSGC